MQLLKTWKISEHFIVFSFPFISPVLIFPEKIGSFYILPVEVYTTCGGHKIAGTLAFTEHCICIISLSSYLLHIIILSLLE